MRALLATPEPCPAPTRRPPRALMALLSRTPRESLEMIIEAAIDELDRRDGDPDAEPEEDAHPSEDVEGDTWHHPMDALQLPPTPLFTRRPETRHAG